MSQITLKIEHELPTKEVFDMLNIARAHPVFYITVLFFDKNLEGEQLHEDGSVAFIELECDTVYGGWPEGFMDFKAHASNDNLDYFNGKAKLLADSFYADDILEALGDTPISKESIAEKIFDALQEEISSLLAESDSTKEE